MTSADGLVLTRCDECGAEAYCECCGQEDPMYGTYDVWFECEKCLSAYDSSPDEGYD